MFHYVFIDPETIAEVAHDEAGLGRLVDVLRSMDRGCLMAETDSWRLWSALKEKAEAIGLHNERKLVGELLIQLGKKGPLIVMEGDDLSTPLVAFAATNAQRDSIDLVLTPSGITPPAQETWEACALTSIHTTRFSRRAHNLGSGIAFQSGSTTRDSLFSRCFSKLIAHAEKIIIIDYALGEYYGNDHPENLRQWVLWIDKHLLRPSEATLVIRTVGKPNSPELRALQNQINGLVHEVDVSLRLETVTSKDLLPHRRFLVVDGSCLDIDRGIDLCDARGNCREVSITYANGPR